MAVLQSRVDQLEIARQAQMNSQHTESLTEISWGNQIRSYVLQVRIFKFQPVFHTVLYKKKKGKNPLKSEMQRKF